MEVLRMDYRFTAVLIIMIILLALFGGPAHPRNEYLNEYGVRCGEFEVSTERRDTDYNYSDSNTHEDEYVRFTYRKYLGTDCKTSKENVAIKQQLELMKMCGRVNANPTLKHNPEFSLLVNKCRGIAPSGIDNRPKDANSHWDTLKNNYKKENPDVILMNDKFIGPKKDK
tara:strand:- start:122 stop:631 length:510 start_codon:yes stop_codon:yes gene_type:complete